MSIREDANHIIQSALLAAQPDRAVRSALEQASFGPGRLTLIAAGKAAWQMARTALEVLAERVSGGVVVTKYGHSGGPLGCLEVYEAGHPVPDENSFSATRRAMEAVSALDSGDTVLFLLSGGGSALLESPLIPAGDLERLTRELLSCGADIVEINTLRKRFSAVKGGKFAALCAPAKVFSVVLLDVVGGPLDMIASGPACPDTSTAAQAKHIADKYRLTLTPQMKELLDAAPISRLDNVETHVTGSVTQLCRAAETACRELGYDPCVLTDSLTCAAREAGAFLGSVAQYHQNTSRSLAFIAGGETVVRLTGRGLGGRNQELALAAAPGIRGLRDTAVFSVGSDGTDGPTDAAGGYVDGGTMALLDHLGVELHAVFQDNDSYHALDLCGGLVKTGPTGTNVNDFSVLLIKR